MTAQWSDGAVAFFVGLCLWAIVEIIKQFRKGIDKAAATPSSKIARNVTPKQKGSGDGEKKKEEGQEEGGDKEKGSQDPNTALSKDYAEFPLHDKEQVSNNTAIYTFKLSSDDQTLGLPIGKHINVMATVDGKEVSRSYTPVSLQDRKGSFDLMIKTYPKGAISSHIGKMQMGEKLKVKGPRGQMNYKANLVKEMGMLAGGTGITPMLQIIRAALRDESDKTKFSLIFANVVKDDILLRKELEDLAEKHKDRFSLYLVLNESYEGFTGGIGFVTADMIKEHIPSPSKDVKVLLCGPPPMINAMKKNLEELGYEKPRTISKTEDQVFCF